MDPQKLSTRELVQLCLETNDEALWAEFVRRHQRLIGGVIAKRVGRYTGFLPSPDLLDDLSQNTYVKIFDHDYKALRNFDFQHENALYGFLKVIAEHVVDDHFRPKKPKPEEIDPDQIPSEPSEGGGSKAIERKILIEEIDRCLQEQKDDPNFTRDYAVFWLYFRLGLTAKEIAALPFIGLSVKGVESTLLRMIRAVRAKVVSKKPR